MLECVQRKILVIDNSPECAARMKTWLSYLGCTVKTTHCGYTGLQLAHDFQPDTIICSTGLPRLNGFQVAKELRADPRTAGIKLIAIIDFRASTLEDLQDSSDFDLHLFKPATIVKLRKALEAVHERPSLSERGRKMRKMGTAGINFGR